MRFSDNLRNLRTSRHLTQMKMAQEFGTSQSAITSWETGTREPDFRTIQRLADYFNVPLSALLPSNDGDPGTSDMVARIMDSANSSPELCVLYDELRTLKTADIQAVLAIVRAIKGDHNG